MCLTHVPLTETIELGAYTVTTCLLVKSVSGKHNLFGYYLVKEIRKPILGVQLTTSSLVNL